MTESDGYKDTETRKMLLGRVGLLVVLAAVMAAAVAGAVVAWTGPCVLLPSVVAAAICGIVVALRRYGRRTLAALLGGMAGASVLIGLAWGLRCLFFGPPDSPVSLFWMSSAYGLWVGGSTALVLIVFTLPTPKRPKRDADERRALALPPFVSPPGSPALASRRGPAVGLFLSVVAIVGPIIIFAVYPSGTGHSSGPGGGITVAMLWIIMGSVVSVSVGLLGLIVCMAWYSTHK